MLAVPKPPPGKPETVMTTNPEQRKGRNSFARKSSNISRPDFMALQRSVRLADQLYEQILDQIVRGKIPMGTRLPSETELCRLFDVSRPVVREAIFRLQADGTVATRHGAGTYVLIQPKDEFSLANSIGDAAELAFCFEFWGVLGSEAAYFAALRRTREEMKNIEIAVADSDAGSGGSGPKISFHVAIARASHNNMFQSSLEELLAYLFTERVCEKFLPSVTNAKGLKTIRAEQLRIRDAIKSRKPEAARKAMRSHIDNIRATIIGD